MSISRFDIVRSAARCRRRSATRLLVAATADPALEVRLEAARALRTRKGEGVRPALEGFLTALEPELRLAALDGLLDQGVRATVPQIVPLLSDPYPPVRHRAAYVAARLWSRNLEGDSGEPETWRRGNPLAPPLEGPLKDLLGSKNTADRLAALRALSLFACAPGLALFRSAATDPDPHLRALAVRGLATDSSGEALDLILLCLDDTCPEVRAAGCLALGSRFRSWITIEMKKRGQDGCEAVIDRLADRLKDGDPGVRDAAALGLALQRDERAVPAITRIVRTGDRRRYLPFMDHLSLLLSHGASGILDVFLSDRDPLIRLRAVQALQQADRTHLAGTLYRCLKDPSPAVRAATCETVRRTICHSARPGLYTALGDISPEVRRAAALALGQMNIRDAVKHLRPRLEDPDDLVKATVAVALGRLGDPWGFTRLTHLVTSPWENWRSDAVEALGGCGLFEATPTLIRALKDGEPSVRLKAAEALGRLGDPAAAAALLELLDSEEDDLPEYAAEALGQLPGDEVFQHLLGLLRHPRPDLAAQAAQALAERKDGRAVGPLCEAAASPMTWLAEEAVRALGQLADPTAAGVVEEAFRSGSGGVRKAAARALARIGGERAVYVLLEGLSQEDRDLRCATVEALGYLDDRRARLALKGLLGGGDPEIARVARAILMRWSSTGPAGARG